jgi:hypothetical protein
MSVRGSRVERTDTDMTLTLPLTVTLTPKLTLTLTLTLKLTPREDKEHGDASRKELFLTSLERDMNRFDRHPAP